MVDVVAGLPLFSKKPLLVCEATAPRGLNPPTVFAVLLLVTYDLKALVPPFGTAAVIGLIYLTIS